MENENGKKEEHKNNKSDEKGKEELKKGSGKNNLKAVIVIILIIAAAGLLLYSLSLSQQKLSPYQMKFAGQTLNFRANLDKAAAVPVLPDGQSIRNIILSGDVIRIRIAYVPEERYNAFYAADSFEIAYKLVILLKYYYGINGYLYEGESKENCLFFEETGKNVCILSEPVPSEEDIKAGNAERAIYLSAANETSVSVKNNIIYIKGKDFSENGRDYTDLDLATDKLLMVMMNQQAK